MEVYIAYGLVLIFFIGFALFVVFALGNPYPVVSSTSLSAREGRQHPKSKIPVERKIAYGLLALLFMLFITLTIMIEKRRSETA